MDQRSACFSTISARTKYLYYLRVYTDVKIINQIFPNPQKVRYLLNYSSGLLYNIKINTLSLSLKYLTRKDQLAILSFSLINFSQHISLSFDITRYSISFSIKEQITPFTKDSGVTIVACYLLQNTITIQLYLIYICVIVSISSCTR